MFLDVSRYVTDTDSGIRFTEVHANHFAKGVAGDFNPIHDIGAKRFCVPGDLLFAALLHRYGVYETLHVDLMSLVSADVLIELPERLVEHNEICDVSGRHLLSLDVSGDVTTDAKFVASLVEHYARFSGKTFPDILVELMKENDVMINPSRPLIIYKSMSLQLDKLSGDNIGLELDKATLEVDGKKGKASLRFVIKDNNDIIGHGEKNMVLSGFRPFDEAAMTDILDEYSQRIASYNPEELEL